MNITIFVLIFTGLFLENCSVNSNTTEISRNILRIVDGTPAKHGEIPYQLSFKMRHDGYFKSFCGGVIIGLSKILSAAHCFAKRNNFIIAIFKGPHTKKPLGLVWAVAGSLKNVYLRRPFVDTMEDGQWRQLLNVTFPHNYTFPKNDIAILFTKTPWTFNQNVNAISYASKYIDYRGEGLISGYGKIGKYGTSKVLLSGSALLLSNKVCNKKHSKKMEKFICTSPIFSDIGKGDSGGPLVCSETGDPKENGRLLVGIVSGKRGSMPFFTRVSSFYEFIEKNKGQLNHLKVYYLFFVCTVFLCSIL